jgi:hypothetical protein
LAIILTAANDQQSAAPNRGQQELRFGITIEPLAKWLPHVILNEVKDLSLLETLDSSLRSE